MRLILFCLLSAILLSSCASVAFHDYAEYDPERAAKLILQLKTDTLLVAYPTYQEKEQIVRSALKKFPESKEKLWKDLQDVKNDRNANMNYIQSTFKANFTFCEYLLIPDSLVHDFENGIERPYFLGENNELDINLTYSNKTPFKLIHRSDTQWEFVIKNELLPNPFPNYIYYRQGDLLDLLGLEDFGDVIKKISKSLNRRLSRFFNNPNSAVRY